MNTEALKNIRLTEQRRLVDITNKALGYIDFAKMTTALMEQVRHDLGDTCVALASDFAGARDSITANIRNEETNNGQDEWAAVTYSAVYAEIATRISTDLMPRLEALIHEVETLLAPTH